MVGCLLVLLGLALTPGAFASPVTAGVPHLDVDVRISGDLSTLAGQVGVELPNARAQPLGHVDLWTFPARLGAPPAALDEVEERRAFPAGFAPGGMDITKVTDRRGATLETRALGPTHVRVLLVEPVPPGGVAHVVVHFRTRVPHRFGPFGHAEGQLTLDGGAIPRPPPLTPDGFAHDAPPGLATWDLSLRWDRRASRHGTALIVANGLVEELVHGAPTRLRVPAAERLSLVLMPRWQRSGIATAYGRVLLVHRRPRRLAARGRVVDLGHQDTHAQVLATVASAVAFGARAGLAPRSSPLVVVETALRRDLAIAAPSMILVSDRAFEVTPLEALRKLQRVPIARAVLSALVAPRVWRVEVADRAAQVVEMATASLAEGWERHVYGKMAGVRALLESGRFVEEVDEIVREPQVAFRSVYFHEVDDSDALRDRFTLFSHQRPSGRLWHVKLHDRVGADATAAVVRAIIDEHRPLAAALAAEGLGDMLPWLERWNTGVPEVNYRLVGWRPTPDGGQIEVRREGEEAVDETVSVEVVTAEGARQRASALATGATVRVPVLGAERPRGIRIDPDWRLLEHDLGRPVDPRYDNRSRQPWRGVVEGLALGVNSASGRVDSLVSGFFRRDHDVNHIVGVAVWDSERRLGASSRWLRGFGPKIGPGRRRYSFGTGLSVSWIKPFDGLAPGAGLSLSLSWLDVTYLSRTSPRRGVARGVAVGPLLAWRRDDARVSGFAGVDLARLLPLGRRQVLAGRLKLDTLFGNLRSGDRWAVGGAGAVRALAPFARTGRHRAVASVEWRHELTRSLSVDLGHLAWLEGIDGVLFIDGALLVDELGDLASASATSLGVGYGLRLHYSLAGFDPLVLAVDAAVPLVEGGSTRRSGGPPVTILVRLGQSF